MNEEALFNSLEAIKKDLLDIKEIVSSLPKKKLPMPYDYNPMGKKKCFSQRLRGGFMDPKIRAFILKLRKAGQPYKIIAAHIKEQWSDQPEKHPSKSAIHRFVCSARNGRLREFGIEGIE
ncbi:MAG: hypothetical protein ABH845_00225 [Candidatus Omnitrophota bacterium]